jgi:glycerol-3-phosphate acyltransferase PlsX
LRSLGVVPHGRFTRTGFAQAILRARRGALEDIVGQTQQALGEAGALRRAPVSAQADSVAGDDRE